MIKFKETKKLLHHATENSSSLNGASHSQTQTYQATENCSSLNCATHTSPADATDSETSSDGASSIHLFEPRILPLLHLNDFLSLDRRITDQCHREIGESKENKCKIKYSTTDQKLQRYEARIFDSKTQKVELELKLCALLTNHGSATEDCVEVDDEIQVRSKSDALLNGKYLEVVEEQERRNIKMWKERAISINREALKNHVQQEVAKLQTVVSTYTTKMKKELQEIEIIDARICQAQAKIDDKTSDILTRRQTINDTIATLENNYEELREKRDKHSIMNATVESFSKKYPQFNSCSVNEISTEIQRRGENARDKGNRLKQELISLKGIIDSFPLEVSRVINTVIAFAFVGAPREVLPETRSSLKTKYEELLRLQQVNDGILHEVGCLESDFKKIRFFFSPSDDFNHSPKDINGMMQTEVSNLSQKINNLNTLITENEKVILKLKKLISTEKSNLLELQKTKPLLAKTYSETCSQRLVFLDEIASLESMCDKEIDAPKLARQRSSKKCADHTVNMQSHAPRTITSQTSNVPLIATEISATREKIRVMEVEIEWLETQHAKVKNSPVDGDMLTELVKEDSVQIYLQQKCSLLHEACQLISGLRVIHSTATKESEMDNLLEVLVNALQYNNVVSEYGDEGHAPRVSNADILQLKNQLKWENKQDKYVIDSAFLTHFFPRLISCMEDLNLHVVPAMSNCRIVLLDSTTCMCESLAHSDSCEQIFVMKTENQFKSFVRVDWQNKSPLDIVTLAINKLLCDEILFPFCKAKILSLRNSCDNVTSIFQMTLQDLYDAYQQINDSTEAAIEDGNFSALSFVKISLIAPRPSQEKFEVCVEICNHLVDLILFVLSQAQPYSPIYNAIVSKIAFWLERYQLKIENIVNTEKERRRKQFPVTKMSIQDSEELLVEEDEVKVVQLDSQIKENEQKIQKIEDRLKKLKLCSNDLKHYFKQEDVVMDSCITTLESKRARLLEELVSMETSISSSKSDVDQQLASIKDIERQQVELIESMDQLKRNEEVLVTELLDLRDKQQQLSQSKAALMEDINVQKQQMLKHASNKRDIENWLEFLSNAYDHIYTSHETFKVRGAIQDKMNECKNLLESYEALVGYVKSLDSKSFREVAARNDTNTNFAENLKNYLLPLLRTPVLTYDVDTKHVTVNEVNLNYSEVEKGLKLMVQQLLVKADLIFNESNKLATTSKSNVKAFLGNKNLPLALQELIFMHINIKCLLKKDIVNDDTSDEATLTSPVPTTLENIEYYCTVENDKTEIMLIQMSVQDIFQKLDISYFDVLKSFVASVTCIASNNIYVDLPLLSLRGINLALIADQDIVLQKGTALILHLNVTNTTDVLGLTINTSAPNAVSFQFKQAFGEPKANISYKVDGVSGVSGMDGFAGGNGGHLYVRAEREVVHMKDISSIDTSGGNGSDGQVGGDGQQGGQGIDNGDAVAEPFGNCFFSPAFVIAFARPPGFNTETQKFDEKLSEFSGRGRVECLLVIAA